MYYRYLIIYILQLNDKFIFTLIIQFKLNDFTAQVTLIFFLHILKNSRVSNICNCQESKTNHSKVEPEKRYKI